MTRTAANQQLRKLISKANKRGPSKAVRTEVPLADTESSQYPDVCHRCGEPAPKTGGRIEQRDAAGTYRTICAGCVL